MSPNVVRAAAGLVALSAATVLAPREAAGQAWLPPAGSGAVAVSFQIVENTGHRLTDGSYVDNGRSRSGALFAEIDYGVTRQFSVSVGVPFVFARYTDDDPPPEFFPFLPRDACRCWHAGLQDIVLTGRWSLVDTFDHVLGISPSLSVVVPSHAYDYRGEAVLGRRLRQMRLGVDVGRRLDEWSRDVTIHGRYGYTLVERVLDLSHDRSHMAAEVEWRAAPAVAIRGFTAVQRTHGGLRAGPLPGATLVGPGEINTPARVFEHDRLLRDNWLHVGAGVTIGTPHGQVFGTYTHFARGTDTHAGHAITTGVVWPFRWR